MDYDDQKPAATATMGGEEDDGTDISFDTADDHDDDIVDDGGGTMMSSGGMIGSWPGGGGGGGGGAFAAHHQGDACVVVPGGGATAMPAIPPFMTNLVISNVREKNANGALLCLVVGCSKNAQGRSFVPARSADDVIGNNPPPPRGGGGFCRAHHNMYLIQTGQVESWGCACGNRVVAESDRCGTCHRWRGGIKQHGKSGTGAAGKAPAKKRAKKAPPPPQFEVSSPFSFGGGLEATPPSRVVGALGSDIRISDVRETNKNGRSLCKVIGCDKLDQARNEGFCRRHYKMIAVVVDGPPPPSAAAAACYDAGMNSAAGGFVAFLGGGGGGGAEFDTGSWNCPCGQVISFKQKRCGKCNKASSDPFF